MTDFLDSGRLIVSDVSEVVGEELEAEYIFRRLPRPEGGYPQCGCSLEDMAPTTSTGYARNWRFAHFGENAGGKHRGHEYRASRDPNFCTRRGVVDVLGVPMCNLHAGQHALRLLLGEWKP